MPSYCQCTEAARCSGLFPAIIRGAFNTRQFSLTVLLLWSLLFGSRALGATDFCPRLPVPEGDVIVVSSEYELYESINTASSGTTILIADGTYNLGESGYDLWITTPDIRLQSQSGIRENVVLDDNYSGTEIITIAASGVTVANLTLKRAGTHAIHVVSTDDGDVVNTVIYNLHIIDPGQQAIKINPHTARVNFPDDGIVACCRVEMTDPGRQRVLDINGSCYTGGVDGHHARGWTIRDNTIEGFWCETGLSEHGVHFWTGSRDTVVERNRFINNARAIGFGLLESGTARTYSDTPCSDAGGYVGHYDGIIRNNFIFADSSDLFMSEYGVDDGVALAQAFGAVVAHNSIVFTQSPFAAIEWRFSNTTADIINNLTTHNFMDRGGTAALSGNLENQPLSLFENGEGGDLHLSDSSDAAIGQGMPLSAELCGDDIDGDTRPLGSARDIGADEYNPDNGNGNQSQTGAGFNYQAYLSTNPDLPADWGMAECMAHYKLFGFREKRAVNFNLDEYLNANPDLPREWTFEQALLHYNIFGRDENRLLAFDGQEYLSLYSDLPQDWSYEEAFAHYLYFGKNEGRLASFDEKAYLELYPDLPGTWGQTEAILHYFYYGKNEGRIYDSYDESVFSSGSSENEAAEYFPYPQHTDYAGVHIKPLNYSQSELDDLAASFYTEWRHEYIKNDCAENEYYVAFGGNNTICVSEGLGYGMVITAIMAGFDEGARSYFDGMYRFYKSHPSSINSSLMAWEQVEGCETNPDGGDDSASDGDIDIAYALLLADSQWGSSGGIDYREEAEKIIAAIMKDEVNPETYTIKLGDWADNSEPFYYYSTRTSDFIMDHFRAFARFSGDRNWNGIIDSCYALIDDMQANYSPSTGLLPDFIVNCNSTPVPANAHFLESEYDGDYYYNACRDPWRIAVDYLVSGDARARNTLTKINSWIIASAAGNPENIKSGYLLDGTRIGDYQDVSFIGAFAVSAMLETQNQQWLDEIFEQILSEKIENNDYYGNTLKVLYLLTISGNYWQPQQ